MLLKPSGCVGCPLEHTGTGFMEATGSGTNGVLLVGEALGANEALEGKPFVGKAGMTLDKMLGRGNMNREDFKIANAIWCQPPGNKFTGEWYEKDALAHCSPYLDRVISDYHPKCIVTLGVTAFRRVLPEVANIQGVGLLDGKKHKGARGYVFWSEKYQTWVIPTVHPSFIMRGKTAWAQVLIHDIQRATEIARDGYSFSNPDYTLDPAVSEALEWVKEFEAYHLAHPDLYLSCDIETPEKGADEEDLDLEDCSDYIILRCGYSYRDLHGLSIPWDGPYRIVHERLLGHGSTKVWWNGSYDIPRILANQVGINSTSHDGMDAWHVLNSDLKKSLGFVAPFFCHGQKMWKHLSGSQPALYNAIDADVAGRIMRGTMKLLKQHGMLKVYNEFVYELDPVFSAMTRAGMPVDIEKRVDSSKKLIEKRDLVRKTIEEIVPQDIKLISPKNGYIKPPKDTTGLVEIVFNAVKHKYCPNCNELEPKKAHFKVYKKKENPCGGLEPILRVEGDKRWAKIQPFVPSTKGILRYMAHMKHPFITTGKGADKKATTDEKAIRKLIGKYPNDKFYDLVLEDREYTKVGGTYIGWWDNELSKLVGGFPLGRDGRVHGHFRHTPSTLRSSMVSPNLQNLPRGDDSDVQKWVKQMFVAPDGWTFVARDFSGIEAVLVGLHAGDRDFMRLSKIDVHSYFTGHNLVRQGILGKEDLPSLSWSDKDLYDYGKQVIKARFKAEREIGKRCIHAGNYRVGPSKLSEEYPKWFPKPKDAARVLAFFYEVFPKINEWHERLCLQVDKSSVFRTSFGHVLRFYEVLKWEKIGTKWEWSYGDDAKRLIAAGPQSDAALIGKRAAKRCYYDYPDSVARWLRLFIHDELFCEVPVNRADECDSILQFEMEKPLQEMPLDPSWGFGTHLAIGSEGKRGQSWASMH